MKSYLLALSVLLALATISCGLTGYSTFEPTKMNESSGNVVLADDDLIKFRISSVCYSGSNGKLYVSIINKSDRWLSIDNMSIKPNLQIGKTEHIIPIVNVTVLDHQRPAPHGGHMVPEWYESFEKVPYRFKSINAGPEKTTERRYSISLAYGRLGLPVEKADSITTTIDFDIRGELNTRHYQFTHSLIRKSHHHIWFLRDD